MKVLGVDPGFGRCGVAVLEKESGKESVLYSSCIETRATDLFPMRLSAVALGCASLIKKYKPETLALERLFFNSNQKTAMQVAEVRGAIIFVAASADLPVIEYTPGQVKVAVTGHGQADKEAVQRMLKSLLKIEKHIQHDDEYDAIAIALTHLACARRDSNKTL